MRIAKLHFFDRPIRLSISVLLLAALPASAQTFAPAVGSPFAAGQNPQSVAISDFNGNGYPDLAIANFGGASVTVLLGNGSGGFTPASGSPFTVGANPDSVAVGDFNGDGKPDLAISIISNNTVTVLLGNGSGGFTPASGSGFSVGVEPESIAVADFNDDGYADLAIANTGYNTVTVVLGNGSGGFTAAPGSPFPAGSAPGYVVNGDGRPAGSRDRQPKKQQRHGVAGERLRRLHGFVGRPVPGGVDSRLRGFGRFQRRRQIGYRDRKPWRQRDGAARRRLGKL